MSFLTVSGKPYASLACPGVGSGATTRRSQILHGEDEIAFDVARAIVSAKLTAQLGLVRYSAKYRDPGNQTADFCSKISAIRREVSGLQRRPLGDCRSTLLLYEARAGRLYWEALRTLYAGVFTFESREHQGACTPFNACLNYGYGILYHTVASAVWRAGLEPYCGFLHTDRPGKESLTLDLADIFRQGLVDRPLLAAFGRGTLRDRPLDDGRLSDDVRRTISTIINDRLSEVVPGFKQHTFRSTVVRQARNVASFLRGEAPLRVLEFKWR